jgi:RNA polymerase sigma factor (TIGR02999 family)
LFSFPPFLSIIQGLPEASLIRGENMTEVTQIMNAIKEGDPTAVDKLLPLVYEELRLLAAQKMSQEKPGQTLQATALVHEAYLRLVGGEEQRWSGRRHFFSAAAEAMRRILVENARRKKRVKRGGKRKRLALEEAAITVDGPDIDLVALDEALAKLESDDPEKASLVKLRYFAGLTNSQAANILKISIVTANRHWSYARSWLFQEISKGD